MRNHLNFLENCLIFEHFETSIERKSLIHKT